MAPGYVSQYKSYLLSKFKITPPPGTGPVVLAGQAKLLGAAYVLIANGASTGPSFFGTANIVSIGTLLS
jgi:hypothetical protein